MLSVTLLRGEGGLRSPSLAQGLCRGLEAFNRRWTASLGAFRLLAEDGRAAVYRYRARGAFEHLPMRRGVDNLIPDVDGGLRWRVFCHILACFHRRFNILSSDQLDHL